jgi:hypothetical protein
VAKNFTPPAIFKTNYTNLESTGVKSAAPDHNHLLAGYYLILVVCIVGTSLLIDRTGLARMIMDTSRTRVSQATKLQNEANAAVIEITPASNLRILAYSPQNLYLGETADGLRYVQIPAGIIDNQHGVSLQMAQSGLYNLEFSSKTPGTYSATITLKDFTGKRSTRHTEKLTFMNNEHIRYNLVFDSQQLPDSNLVFKNIFYRN